MALADRVKKSRQRNPRPEQLLTEKQLAELRQVVIDFVLTGLRSKRLVADLVIEEYKIQRRPTAVKDMITRIVQDELAKKDIGENRNKRRAAIATRKAGRSKNQTS